MNLTLALDLTSLPAKGPHAAKPGKAQDSAISKEFASLLELQGGAGAPAADAILAAITADGGKPLPAGSGKLLPVAAGDAPVPAGESAELVAEPAPAVATIDPDFRQPNIRLEAAGQPPASKGSPMSLPQQLEASRNPVLPGKPEAAGPEAKTAGLAAGNAQAAPDVRPAVPRPSLQIEVKAEQAAPQPAAAPTVPLAAQAAAAQPIRQVRANSRAGEAETPATPPEAAGAAKAEAALTRSVRRVNTESAATGAPRADAESPATERTSVAARSIAPLPVTAAAAPAAQPAIIIADAQPQLSAATGERPAAMPQAAERHDFNSVVERLAAARESASPGRADMQLLHREFGNISVRFEMTGQSLKVALASGDAAFAPAVQAAMAERPIVPVTDTARADAQAGRQDGQGAGQNNGGQGGQSGPQSQAQAQADGQRHDSNSRAAQQRQAAEQNANRQQAGGEGASARTARNARDGNLFA